MSVAKFTPPVMAVVKDEFPIFAQYCPECHRVRVRMGSVWINGDPDDGWYSWWSWECAERFQILDALFALHHYCEDCALQLLPEGGRTLQDVYWTLDLLQ